MEAASSFLIENQWSKNPPDRVGTAFSGFRNSRLNNQFGIQINGNSTNVVADKYSNEATRACHRDQFLLGFSAHNERTLKANVAALSYVCDNYSLVDLAYNLAV